MSNEANVLLDEYREHIRMYLWYTPNEYSFFKNKANKQLAEQHRINAQVFWALYQKKTGKT